jgi:hypothetical protein
MPKSKEERPQASELSQTLGATSRCSIARPEVREIRNTPGRRVGSTARECPDRGSRRGQCTPPSAGNDKNRTTNFTYSRDNRPATVAALNATTGNQTTIYQYGTTLTESAVASGLLKRYEVLPDSASGSDRKAFTCSRQSQTTTFADLDGSAHTYTFDKLGRQIDDGITTLGSGVDGAVWRIATSFEVRGLVQNLTSYDNATVGSGNAVNEVQFAYNSFQQLVTVYQSHSGAVNVAATPNVVITAPRDDYPGNGGVFIVRTTRDTARRAFRPALDRLAPSTVARAREVSTRITRSDDAYIGNDPDAGDIYRGLDRFSRVKDLIWAPSASSSSSSSSSSGVGGRQESGRAVCRDVAGFAPRLLDRREVHHFPASR